MKVLLVNDSLRTYDPLVALSTASQIAKVLSDKNPLISTLFL